MSIQNLLLLIAGLINLMMFFVVVSRGLNNKMNLYFGFLTLANFLWTLSILIARMGEGGMFWYYAGALLAYPIALCIALSLYFFSRHFPIPSAQSKSINDILLLLGAFILSVIVYIKGAFVLSYNKDIANTEYTLYVNKPFYILYSLYFIFVALLALWNLYCKIRSTDHYFKKQTIVLFIAILIGLVFGVYYDLILCYFANYHYAWFGPVFTLFMNAVVFYFIISPREKISN
jgi:hypothetical protein